MQDRPRAIPVIFRENLAPGTVRLRLERPDCDFRPGQYMALGAYGDRGSREYSIHSGLGDPWLDFLIREVGPVSRGLAGGALDDPGSLAANDQVEAEGPFGFFGLEDQEIGSALPVLMIATGVGIAPLHSLVRSWPKLDYLVLHGVRCAAELYDRGDFAIDRHLACLSGEVAAECFSGRVTEWLRIRGASLAGRWGADWPRRALCLLAGNSDMVHEAWDILADWGVTPDRIRTEIFF